MSRYTRRLTSCRFQDAVGFGISVGPTEGDDTIGEYNAEFAEHQPIYDRDQFDGFTIGQDQVVPCSLTLQMRNEVLTSAVAARILDFIYRRGTFAPAFTQSVDPTIWAWVTIYTFDDGTTSTTRTLPYCEGGAGYASGQPYNNLNLSWNNHQAPVDA